MLRAYCWLCAEKSLLVVLKGPNVMSRIESRLPMWKQIDLGMSRHQFHQYPLWMHMTNQETSMAGLDTLCLHCCPISWLVFPLSWTFLRRKLICKHLDLFTSSPQAAAPQILYSPSISPAVLQNYNKWFHLLQYPKIHSSRPRLEQLVSELDGNK